MNWAFARSYTRGIAVALDLGLLTDPQQEFSLQYTDCLRVDHRVIDARFALALLDTRDLDADRADADDCRGFGQAWVLEQVGLGKKAVAEAMVPFVRHAGACVRASHGNHR